MYTSSKTVITDLQVTAHTIVPHPKNTLLHVTKALQDAWNAAVQDVKALLNGSKKAHTAANAEAVPWDGITGKPSTFTPSAHNHDDRYYTETEMNTKLNGKANSSHTHTKDQVGLSKVNNNAISMGYDGNLYTNIYADFTYPRSIGKQCVTKVAYATGEPVEEVHLVATLEQLTFVERQLAALGL